MNDASYIAGAVVLLFGFVVLFGAPYLPTRRQQINDALDLLALKPGQTLLELGCGDGRVLLAAAKRGIRSVGYELNPLLVLIAWAVTLRYRSLVKVRLGNYWHKSWPDADGVYVFLLDKYMQKLDRKLTNEFKKPVKLVSFAFKIPNKKPAKTRGGLFLYKY